MKTVGRMRTWQLVWHPATWLAALWLLAGCHSNQPTAPAPPATDNGNVHSVTSGGGSGSGSGSTRDGGIDAGADAAAGGTIDGMPLMSSGASSSPVDTSNVPMFVPAVDATRKLADLSGDELNTLCQAAQAYIFAQVTEPDLENAICYVDHGQIAMSVTSCKAAVADCRSSTIFDSKACILDVLKRDSSSCDAAVGDYNGCIVEQTAISKAAVGYYTCDLLDTSLMHTAPQQLTATELKCGKLLSACPQL